MYYRVYPNEEVADLLVDLVQVAPRGRSELRPGQARGFAGGKNSFTGTNAPHEEDVAESEGKDSFALFFLSQKLLSEPKMVCHARVVVVGGSDAGLVDFICRH